MKLELFVMTGCPYCGRVLGAIEASGRKDIELHNITTNRGDYNRLLEEGGKIQAPCLFIDGKPMYESTDIIAWLSEHPEEA